MKFDLILKAEPDNTTQYQYTRSGIQRVPKIPKHAPPPDAAFAETMEGTVAGFPAPQESF